MRWLILFAALFTLACGSGDITAAIGTQPESDISRAADSQYTIWAVGNFAWDPETESISFNPHRSIEAYHDVWPYLNPPECSDCVKVDVLSIDPAQKLVTVNVTLKNPTPMNGFFVRGIVIPGPDNYPDFIDPDSWWHPADFGPSDDPVGFKTFAINQDELKFGPGESYMRTYHFRYQTLADFNDCEYRVIVRFPKYPAEVTAILPPEIHGAYTTSGGFVTLRSNVVSNIPPPPFTVTGYRSTGGVNGPTTNLRNESGDTYLGWFEGIPTSEDHSFIWILATTNGSQDSLAYRYTIPVEDVIPTPDRVFPIVTEGVKVFVDQLPGGMTEAQIQFMAENCVGSQKLVKTIADSMRVYNPDFIIMQYHLAFGEGDISNIHGNDWVKNWTFVDAQEDFFEHRSWSLQPNQRVLQQDWQWYLTDPESDWVNYFIGNTIERMDPLGDQFDAVFADSASQPWNTDPSKWWEGSDNPQDMFVYWTPKTQYFLDKVARVYHTLPVYRYLIPNSGSYVTTNSDITYYQCDGIMMEGFGHWSPGSYFTEIDWMLMMNRGKNHASLDMVILCQTGVDPDDKVDRKFILGSYMLLQDKYTYLNMLGPWGLDPQFWPEYSFNPGPAVDNWTSIDEILDAGGCYVRNFENGIVIVNPSDEVRWFTTTKPYQYMTYIGGGLVPADGSPNGGVAGEMIGGGPQQIDPHSAWLGIG